jgi:hypothetical protein
VRSDAEPGEAAVHDAARRAGPPPERGGQGEALVVWAVWGFTLLAVLLTYSRIDAAQLYNVTGDGLSLGLSRAAVHTNWPFALVAIVLVLVAMRALPRRAWWLGGPALALCASMPLFVSQAHLNARWGNLVPGVGAALALCLTVAATRRCGASLQPRLPGDPVRLGVTIVVLVLSLPWVFAELGFQFPGDVFMGEELMRTDDGGLEAAVHFGEHHGFHGSLMLLSALLLSRVQAEGRLRPWLLAGTSSLAAYGAVNAAQDVWYEQLVKRGTVSWKIPSALYPGLKPVTLATIVLAGLVAWLLSRERAILRA